MEEPDGWDPVQYERFKAERRRPFDDLLALVRPVAGGRAIDLGCGAGELTSRLHQQLGLRETVGLDLSPAMLSRKRGLAGAGLRFVQGDFATPLTGETWDLVFSNAAFQWVEDHQGLITRWSQALAPGGQLAIQLPANLDLPTHALAHQLAHAAPFSAYLSGPLPQGSVLSPAGYAKLLFENGLREQHVRLQVYGHLLPSRDEVLKWVKGTLLADYRRRLPPELWRDYREQYREMLLSALEDQRPYFFPFQRILLWGRR